MTLQAFDPILDGWVCREHLGEPGLLLDLLLATGVGFVLGVGDEEVSSRVHSVGRFHSRVFRDEFEGFSQGPGIASIKGSRGVSEIFTVAGKGQSDESQEGSADEIDHNTGEDDTAGFFSSSSHEDFSEHGDGSDHGDDDELETDVVVGDMAHFMGEDSFELAFVELVDKPSGETDHSVLWVSTGGKGIQAGIFDDVDLGVRKAGRDGKVFDDVVDVEVRLAFDGFGPHELQDHLISEEIGEEGPEENDGGS